MPLPAAPSYTGSLQNIAWPAAAHLMVADERCKRIGSAPSCHENALAPPGSSDLVCISWQGSDRSDLSRSKSAVSCHMLFNCRQVAETAFLLPIPRQSDHNPSQPKGMPRDVGNMKPVRLDRQSCKAVSGRQAAVTASTTLHLMAVVFMVKMAPGIKLQRTLTVDIRTAACFFTRGLSHDLLVYLMLLCCPLGGAACHG